MRKFILAALSSIPVAIVVALTYFYFEYFVRQSINYIWDTTLKTQTHRWLVVPTCLLLTFVFFGVQHALDKRSETHKNEGLGNAPKPTIQNYLKVLFIGFLSLIAGASLGPEAILVPASMVVGGYFGSKLFKKQSDQINIMLVAAFVALFTAFFHSVIFGILGLLLATKILKAKLNLKLFIISLISAFSCLYILHLLSSAPYTALPSSTWKVSFATVLTFVCLLVVGFVVTYILKFVHDSSDKLIKPLKSQNWWTKAALAAIVLSVIFLLGGHLIEFTGNESIIPMLNQAQQLGYIGLLWLFVTKIIAIGWSKASGYRGGLIFPTLFVAATAVAFSQLISKDISFNYAMIAVIIGAFASNSKLKFLF